MSPPASVKDIQRLTGRLATLNKFLSKSVKKSLSFFKILKKADQFQWDDNCQNAFDDLNKHLNFLPRLSTLRTGEELFCELSLGFGKSKKLSTPYTLSVKSYRGLIKDTHRSRSLLML